MNNSNSDTLGSVILSPSVLIWITICSIVMSPINTIGASAQFLIPPVPDLNVDENEIQVEERQFQFRKSFQPPTIEVMTKVLTDGKNVFRMNITSEAPIEDCKITFAKGDAKRTEDCVKDIGTVFKALIDAKQPFQTVHIDARDIYGDSSSTVEKLSVLPKPTINEAIWNSLIFMLDTTAHMSQNLLSLTNFKFL
jgi:hypothetical protein